MVKVHLLGRILPSEPKISIANLPGMNLAAQELGFSFDFMITVQDSKIDVECSLPHYKPEYRVEIHRRSFDLCRGAFNLAPYLHGYGLTIILDELVTPDGQHSPLIFEDKRLPPLVSALRGGADFDRIFRIVAVEPVLIRHLDDLIHAISVPHEAVSSCARAIDGLKHLIAKPGSNDKNAWLQMQDALLVDCPIQRIP